METSPRTEAFRIQLFNFVENIEMCFSVLVVAHKNCSKLFASFQARINEDWRSTPHGSSRRRHLLVTSLVPSGDARHLLPQYKALFLNLN